MRSREDVALCRECVGWLESQLGVTSTPTLPVVNMDEAIEFYERGGTAFNRVWWWRDNGGNSGGGGGGIPRDD